MFFQDDPNAAQPPAEPQQDLAVHAPMDFHGMFGLHGAARNILGTLGDAFLVQSGNHPVYAPQRDREREANAMRTLTDDPMHAIQALSRENPAAARTMYNDYLQNSRLGRAADDAYTGVTVDRGARLLASARPENYAQIRNHVVRYFAARGVPLPADLPETYDPDAVDTFRHAAVPVTNQFDDQENHRYHDELLTNADARQSELDSYRDRYLGIRAREAQTRERQGDRRLDQGDTKIQQGDRRLGQGDTRLQQGDRRLGQGDRALDQYDSGVRGNTRRPRPSTIQHRINPDGTVSIRRLVNGQWVNVR